MKESTKKTLVGVTLGVLITVGILMLAFWLFFRQKGAPTVAIYAPASGDQLKPGLPVILRALASDDAGIDRLELWMDGSLIASQASSLPGGSSPFPLVEFWKPSRPGQHTLIARAVTHDGRKGQALVEVAVLDEPQATPAPYQVQEGDTLSGIADSFNTDTQALQEANPGLTEPLAAGSSVLLPSSGESDAARPTLTPLTPLLSAPNPSAPHLRAPINDLLDPARRELSGLSTGRPLRVEELSLEVDKAYGGVYCYASLDGGMFNRLPSSGFMANVEGLRWSPGASGLPVAIIPAGQPSLAMRINCLGYQASSSGGTIFDLGTLDATHARAEWDGRPFTAEAHGSGGWFRLSYAIRGSSLPTPTPGPAGTPAPPALILYGGCYEPGERPFITETTCMLEWSFEGGIVPDWVEGYRIFRNGALDTTLFNRDTMYILLYDDAREIPLCGTTDEFYVVAYGGSTTPVASGNRVTLSDPLCRNRSRVAAVYLMALNPQCLRAETMDPPLHTWGLGAPRDAAGNYIWGESCSDTSSPDSWPEMVDWCRAYGQIAVNGVPIFGWCDRFDSGTIYRLQNTRADPGRGYGFNLNPTDNLVISANFWDSDLSSADDPLCAGNAIITHDTLDAVMASPSRSRVFESDFPAEYGVCLLRYYVEVIPPEEADQPPAPIIIP